MPRVKAQVAKPTAEPVIEAPPAEPVVEAPPAEQSAGQETVTVVVPTDEPVKRSFTVFRVNKNGIDGEAVEVEGKRRYLSKNPAGATKKAATRIIREVFGNNDNACSIYIVVQEMTRGSKKASYAYIATRSLSKEKREPQFTNEQGVKFGGIGFKYDIKLKSERKPPAPQVIVVGAAPEEPATPTEPTVSS